MSRLLHRPLIKGGAVTGYCRDCHSYVMTVERRAEECWVRLRRALDAAFIAWQGGEE